MMKRAIVAALVAVTIGCGNKTSPTAPSTGPESAALRIVALQIIGPAQVSPGSITPYQVMATRSDHSQEEVTTQATWTSSNPAVLSVDGGKAVAIEDGETGITAQFNGLITRLVVSVLEAGTSIVMGGVFDSGFPLAGARVEVIAGTGAGKATTTDTNGNYKLFGLAGTIELRASLDGYQPDTRGMTVTGGSPRLSFTLLPAIAPTDFSGAWDLTFDASPSCTSLIDVARHRSYVATISQKVSALTIRLSGAQFAPDPIFGSLEDTFRARVIGDSVTIKLDTYEYYGIHYDVGEVLPDHRVLTIVGDGTGAVAASTISGTLSGTFNVAGTVTVPLTSSCAAADHRFSFVRRSVTSRR